MEFLCGCNRDDKKTYSIQVDHSGNLRSSRFDAEHYEICPEHGERLYGWRTPIVGGSNKLDLNFAGKDNRDTRDPEQLGAEILAEPPL